MALIKCSECGNEISSNAASCPHCGNPIKSEPPKEKVIENSVKKKKPGCLTIIGIIILFFLVVGIIGRIAGVDKDDSKDADNTVVTSKSDQSNNKNSAEVSNNKIQVEETKKVEDPYSFEYDDMTVKYIKSEIGENSVGDTCLIVYYEFTNNSDDNKSFIYSFTDKAFQNGVELESSLFHANDETKNHDKEIQPGTTLTVATAFELGDSRDKVTLQVEPWISFSSKLLMEIEIELE